MGRFGVVGADGFVGGLVAAELRRLGHAVDVLDHVRGGPARPDDTVVDADAADADTADAATADTAPVDADTADTGPADVDVVINAAGPFDRTASTVAAAAIGAGSGYVDVTIEPDVLRRLHDEWDHPARSAGVSLVAGAGLVSAVGDLLAAIAAADQLVEVVEVAYAFPVARTARGRRWSSGTRRTCARLAGLACSSLVDGAEVDEPIGSWRRLAWFPRPVGPRHAAVVPGCEAITVPRWLPGAHTVRTYLALPGWQAELLQATSRMVRRRPDGLVSRWLGGGGAAPDRHVRSATRWAVVVEAAGPQGLTRAWAWGRDPYGTSAAMAVAVAEHIGRGDLPAGAATPAACGPDGLLDLMAARTGLRWGVRRGGSLR